MDLGLVVLSSYGSEAGYFAAQDSDIDLLVLLHGPVELGRDLKTITDALYDLHVQTNFRPIHAIPADIDTFRAAESPLYIEVNQKGVFI